MLLLADQIAETFPDGSLLYGARDASAVFPTEGCPFPVYRATIDGSIGHRGTVVELLSAMHRQGTMGSGAAAVYACGPLAMLRVLSETCENLRLPVQVSLETTFGCGTGLCAGCAVPLRARSEEEADPFRRYAFACTDGPVFDGVRVDWQEVRE